MGTVAAILTLIEEASQALPQIEALYNTIKGDFSTTDQATIEAAIAAKKAAAEASVEKLEADVQG
jgi:hypothetical protein